MFGNWLKKKEAKTTERKAKKSKSIVKSGELVEGLKRTIYDLQRVINNREEQIEMLQSELSMCKSLLVEKTIKPIIQKLDESGLGLPLPKETLGMAASLLQLDEELERLKEAKKAADYKYDTVNEALKIQMVSNNIGKFEFMGMLFHFVEKLSCNILKANRPLVIQALKDNGHTDIIKDDVGTADLKEIIKLYREENEGKELPEYLYLNGEPLVSVYAPVVVGTRKAVSKKK